MSHKIAVINGKKKLNGAGGITDADLQNHSVNFLTSGILSSGALAVTSNNTMIVSVAAGAVYLKTSDGSKIFFDQIDAENVTIPGNANGNPLIGALVEYVNLSGTPDQNGIGVAQYMFVAGSPAASPVAPNDAAIQAAVGTGNPFYRIENILVRSGTTQIITSDLTDMRAGVQFKIIGGYFKYDTVNSRLMFSNDGTNYKNIANPSDAWITLTDGATVNLDLTYPTTNDLKKKYSLINMAGNRNLAFTNIPSSPNGLVLLLLIGQDSTGSRLISAWPNVPIASITMDISTDIITCGKDIMTGTPVKFSTTGALPTGITAGTVYYAVRQSATTFKIASSFANAQAGTTIDLTGTQSGTHSMTVEIRWPDNTAPSLSTGKNQLDLFGLTFVSDVNIVGSVISQGA